MGRYTEVTEISQEDYISLAGLLAIAKEHNAALKTIERAIAKILGEKEDNGHASDAVYCDYSVKELLDKSDITVRPKQEVSPTCEVIKRWDEDAPAEYCGAETVAFYPAAGGGFMALCEQHAGPHGSSVLRVEGK